jgi:hypothetical protein
MNFFEQLLDSEIMSLDISFESGILLMQFRNPKYNNVVNPIFTEKDLMAMLVNAVDCFSRTLNTTLQQIVLKNYLFHFEHITYKNRKNKEFKLLFTSAIYAASFLSNQTQIEVCKSLIAKILQILENLGILEDVDEIATLNYKDINTQILNSCL